LETSILEAIPHAVLGLSGQGIIFANSGVETVFGWKPEELVGREIEKLFRSEREASRFKKNLFLTLDRQQTFYTEFPCRSRGGSDMDCMVSASRITDGSTERKVVVTFEDITDRKRIGRELEHSRQRLRSLSAHLEEIREKERAHIARELHDELGQLLTALHMDLVLLTRQIPPEQSALQTATASMIQLIDRIMTTLKRIYLDLPGRSGSSRSKRGHVLAGPGFQRRTGIPAK
jgi:PAS domain S-box-containing protein